MILMGLSWALYQDNSSAVVPVTTFSECASAGFPVLDGPVRKCAIDGRVFIEDSLGDVIIDKNGSLVIMKPQSEQVVTSPLVIQGRAVKSVFTSGGLGLEVYDNDDVLLGRDLLDLVPEAADVTYGQFTAAIELERTDQPRGYVIVKPTSEADNNSVEPIIIPIAFSADTWPASDLVETTIFFHNQSLTPADSGDCGIVFPVFRSVAASDDLSLESLSALVNGPTDEERAAGYTTSFNSRVVIQDLQIADRVAYVDFNDQFSRDVSDECRVQALTEQVKQTVLQFPGIDDVKISVNGQFDDIF